MEHSQIIERSNPYAKLFQWLIVIFGALIGIIYFTEASPAAQIPFAYAIPLFEMVGISLMAALYLQGSAKPPALPLWLGVAVIVGGAFFDMLTTVVKSPNLTLEGNPIARALLDGGYSLSFVYGYGLFAQILAMTLGCMMWAVFLRHKKTLIASAKNPGTKSYLDFTKVAFGGEDLSWRQFLFPLKISEFAKSYHTTLAFNALWVGLTPYRWYLGFEWLSGINAYRTHVTILLLLAFAIGYLLWLWREYSPDAEQHDPIT